MEKLLTAREFATATGREPRTVQRWAKEAGFRQVAGAYIATRPEWDALAARERKAGRPPTTAE